MVPAGLPTRGGDRPGRRDTIDPRRKRRLTRRARHVDAALLQTFIDQVSDYAIYMIDVTGHVRSWNAGAARLKGYSADEIVGSHFSRFFTPEGRAAGRPGELLARAAAEGRVEDEDWRIRKDGSRFWANIVLTAVYDDRGGLRGFTKVTRHTTERRRLAFVGEASAILLSSFDYEQTLARVAALCVPFLADWAAIRLVTDGELRRVAAHHADPLKQQLLRELPPGSAVGGAGRLAQVVATGEAQLFPDITDAFLSREVEDPSRRALLERLGFRSAILVPLKTEEATLGVLTLASAESGRRYGPEELAFARELGTRCGQAVDQARAHVQAQVEREFLRAVVSEMREGVMVREAPSGRLLLSNDQAGRILREGPGREDALVTRAFLDAEGRPIAPEALPLQRALVQGERSQEVELSFVDGEENRALSLSAAPVTEASGRILGAVATFRDVTAQKERLKALEEEVAFRELFFGIVGHDLRSPLSAIMTGAGLLLRRGVPQEHVPVIRRIQSSAERMKGMVADLLDLTRARLAGGIPIAPRPTDLEELCRSVISEVGTAHPDSPLAFTREGDVHATVDPDRMAQVVANLLSNAVRYGSDAPISVKLRGAGDGVALEIHNGGDPIPTDLLPILFDPFRRASAQRESPSGAGLGLGLFIVREIVDGHRGTISVSSTREDGTTFRAWLPRDPASAPRPRPPEGPNASAPGLRPTERNDLFDAFLLH